MKERLKRLLKSKFLYAFGIRVIGALSIFGMNALLAKVMSPDAYGDLAFILGLLGLIMLTGNLGMNTAALRFVASYREIAAWSLLRRFMVIAFQTTLITASAAALVFIILGLFASPSLFNSNRADALIYGAFLALLLPLVNVCAGIQRGSGAIVTALSPYSLMYPIVTMLVVLFTLSNGVTVSLEIAILALSSGGTFALIIAGFACWRLWQKIGKAENEQISAPKGAVGGLRHWLDMSISTLPSTLSVQAPRQMDTIVLAFLVTPSELGVYFLVSRLVRLSSFGLNAAGIVVSPQYAAAMEVARNAGDVKLSKEINRKKMQALSRKAILASVGLALPLIFILFLAGSWLLSWLGDDFVLKGITVLYILLVGESVNVLCGTNAVFLNMTGLEKRLSVISIVFLITHLVMVAVGGFWGGLLGAAMATSLVVTIRNIVVSFTAWRSRGVDTTILSLLHKR